MDRLELSSCTNLEIDETTRKTLSVMKAWQKAVRTANGDPAHVACNYAPDAELKGTIAANSVFTPEEIHAYFVKFLGKAEGNADVQFLSLYSGEEDGVVEGRYNFVFKDAQTGELTTLPATFAFKGNESGDKLSYHHSYKLDENPLNIPSPVCDADVLEDLDLGA